MCGIRDGTGEQWRRPRRPVYFGDHLLIQRSCEHVNIFKSFPSRLVRQWVGPSATLKARRRPSPRRSPRQKSWLPQGPWRTQWTWRCHSWSHFHGYSGLSSQARNSIGTKWTILWMNLISASVRSSRTKELSAIELSPKSDLKKALFLERKINTITVYVIKIFHYPDTGDWLVTFGWLNLILISCTCSLRFFS